MTEYRYASREEITDHLEQYMDHYKLLRERSAIELFFHYDWKSALDFGCGSGRYLPLFRGLSLSRSFPRRVLGVDADRARLEEAQTLMIELGTRENFLMELRLRNESIFETDLRDVTFDLILCSHVLEHVSESTFHRIVSGISSCTASGGRAIFLLQCFWNGQVGDKELGEADQYLHLIDTTKVPNTSNYRIDTSEKDFDAQVRAPEQGLLPVRALAIGERPKRITQLAPLIVDECPTRMRPYLEGFDWSGFMYAQHLEDDCHGSIVIGDFIFGFDKP